MLKDLTVKYLQQYIKKTKNNPGLIKARTTRVSKGETGLSANTSKYQFRTRILVTVSGRNHMIA